MADCTEKQNTGFRYPFLKRVVGICTLALVTACDSGSITKTPGPSAPPPHPLLPTHPDIMIEYAEQGGEYFNLTFDEAEKVPNSDYFYPLVIGSNVDEFLASEVDGIGIWGYRIENLELDLNEELDPWVVDAYIRFEQPIEIYRDGMQQGESIGWVTVEDDNNPRQTVNAFVQLDAANTWVFDFFEIFIDPSKITLPVEAGWSEVVSTVDPLDRYPGRDYLQLRYSFKVNLGFFSAVPAFPAEMLVTSEMELVEGIGIISRDVFVTQYLEDFKPLDFNQIVAGDKDEDQWMDLVDAFPNNPEEWLDSDGDGIGDNADDEQPVQP